MKLIKWKLTNFISLICYIISRYLRFLQFFGKLLSMSVIQFVSIFGVVIFAHFDG